MFAIKHEAEQDGVGREYLVHEVEPIGFSDFCAHLDGGKDTFPILARARVHAAPDLPVGTRMKIGHTVVFNRAMRHYALVPGGILPPQYVVRGGTLVLMDRNVVSDLRRMPAVDPGEPHPLRWLDSEEFRVNPILGAMEGQKQRPLCYNEFRAELRHAQDDVRQRLPHARLVEFSGAALDGMYSLHRTFVRRLKREQAFLHAISSRLADPLPSRDLRKAEQFVLQEAANAGLRPLTFVVLAVLAKLYEGNDHRPASKLLKLSDLCAAGPGWRRSAHNALADIRQMEMLSTGRTMPDYVVALTGDVGLAQVWCGLRPTGVKFDNGTIGFHVNLDAALFPRLEGSTDEMLARMKASQPALRTLVTT